MANKIQLKRGVKSRLSTLSSGEPAFTTDTRELFVGTGSGNVNMSGNKWYNGTDMSGTSTASTYTYSGCPLVKPGDMYLNTSTGGVYECTTSGGGADAKWTYKGSIKGADGEDGRNGYDSFPIECNSQNELKIEIPKIIPRIGIVDEALSPGLYWVHSDYVEGDPIDLYRVLESSVNGEVYTSEFDLNGDTDYLIKLTADHKVMILDSGEIDSVTGQTMFLRIVAKLLKPYLT